MKYCPYCGTEIVDDDSLFCVGCGKELPTQKTVEEPENHLEENFYEEEVNQSPNSNEQLRSEYDEGYDGYYEDLLLIDKGQVHIGIDQILVKKIAALVGCVLFVIALCLVMMYVF